MASLDDPQVEYLSRIHHIVLFANPPAELLMLIPGKSGDNAVHQCGTEIIFPYTPCLKFLSQLPLFCVTETAFFQLLAVVVNQLTGENNETFKPQPEPLI